MSDNIKIMLVDNYIIIRQGIKMLLEADGKIKVIDEADSGFECLEKLKVICPDIILLDSNVSIENEIEIIKKIKKLNKDIKILILVSNDELQSLDKDINNYIDGCILKSSEFFELEEAIHTILDGEKYIPIPLIQMLNNKVKNNIKHILLTKREQEILINVAYGMSNKEIATNLKISERTVKNHVSNIFKKIKVSDRTQAAIYAIKNNIVIV